MYRAELKHSTLPAHLLCLLALRKLIFPGKVLRATLETPVTRAIRAVAARVVAEPQEVRGLFLPGFLRVMAVPQAVPALPALRATRELLEHHQLDFAKHFRAEPEEPAGLPDLVEMLEARVAEEEQAPALPG